MFRLVFVSFFFLLLVAAESRACGFSFVGECSSSVSLSINGTTDSFAVSSCPGVLHFDGFSLGSLQSLHLTRAKGVTWESCQNNVSGMSLFYRVYEQGFPGGNWHSFSLEEDYNTLVGPYTTRYRSHNTDIDLTGGLTAGKTYVLELYYLAEVDTVGDDFIAETTLRLDNNGQNYHFSFEYGGTSAPPFVVAATKNTGVKCHGQSNGVAGVSVYGNQNGLFYQWSTGGNNFPILTNLAAGTYTVTVTGSGHTASATVEITEPLPLVAQFYPVAGVGCGGAPGEATTVPAGGTPPYDFHWENGQETPAAMFPAGGSYAVTVTDDKGCSDVFSVDIPPQPVVEITAAAEICGGETFSLAGLVFNETGYYEATLPGSNGGCDTLLRLTLDVLNPAAAFAALPDTALITCLDPAINLCAAPVANTTYQWSVNGNAAGTSLCLLTTQGGSCELTATTAGQTKMCAATKAIPMEIHTDAPLLSASGTLSFISHCYTADTAVYLLSATTNAQGPAFRWYFDGQLVSTVDTLSLVTTFFGVPNAPNPSVYVTDQYGCKTGPVPATVLVIDPLDPPAFNLEQYSDLCAEMVEVHQFVTGGLAPYTVKWNGVQVASDTFLRPPGTYEVEITDAEGCSTVYEVDLSPLLFAWVEHVPYGNNIGGTALAIATGDDGNYTYLWNTGETTNLIEDLGAGTFCVTVTDTLTGCSIDTCLTVLVSADEPAAVPLRLFPNPAAPGGWVNAGVPFPVDKNEWSLDILDLQGKTLRGLPIRNDGNSLLFQAPADVSNGLYTVVIRDGDGKTLVGRLVLR